MRRRVSSLRSALVAVTVLVAVLLVFITASLMTLTTLLHRATESAGSAVESVHLVEEAEIDLLLHGRARSEIVRRELEGDLRRKLSQASRFVTTDEEAALLATAAREVDAYIESAMDPARPGAEVAAAQAVAFEALELLVGLNIEQAREAQERAAWWSRLADAVGLGICVFVVLAAGLLLGWLRGRAFEPVFDLARVMERFGSGDREARAQERGPAELREMSRRFNEMAATLAAQRQAQIAFLGGVAHDLRSPLAALSLAVATIRPDRPLPPEPRLRHVIEVVRRQAARLERMIEDLLDLARFEAGELELRLETRDLRGLLQEVLELVEETASGRHLRTSLPDDEVLVRCDPLRLEQVLTNLIDNAIKYSPSGGTVEVALRRSGDEAVLSVTDQGVGIAESDLERLFEPFRRVGLSRETAPGVGLGLFVVKRIVTAHGGRVEVESRPEVGSTFRVSLRALPTER